MSSPLLINEPPLQVLPSLAKEIGLNEAIVLQQLHYWLQNKHAGIESRGKKWVFNSITEWQEQFPFWSTDTVKRAFCSLRKRGFVIARKLSRDPWDKTLYYSIDYGKLNETIGANCPNPQMQSEPISTETTTETTQRESTTVATAQGEPSDETPLPPPPASPFDAVKSDPPAKLQQTDAEARRLYEAFRAVKFPREMPGTWAKAEWLDALPTLRQWATEGRTCAEIGAATREAMRRNFPQVTVKAVAVHITELLSTAKPLRTVPPPAAVELADTFVPPSAAELAALQSQLAEDEKRFRTLTTTAPGGYASVR